MKYAAATRTAYGVLLLLMPSVVIRVASGGPADRTPLVVGRVLGLRHLIQALIIERRRTCKRLLVGTAIDAVHALSMVGIAVLNKNHRQLAMLDAVLATGLAIDGLREARNA